MENIEVRPYNMKNLSWSYYTEHEDVTSMRITVDKNQIQNFIHDLCEGDSFYDIVNEDGTKCVNARSILGVLYAINDFKEMFLVNLTHDGEFSGAIMKYKTDEIKY